MPLTHSLTDRRVGGVESFTPTQIQTLVHSMATFGQTLPIVHSLIHVFERIPETCFVLNDCPYYSSDNHLHC